LTISCEDRIDVVLPTLVLDVFHRWAVTYELQTAADAGKGRVPEGFLLEAAKSLDKKSEILLIADAALRKA
jgi:hypothetical protein